jgi:hypothetical protein
MLPQEATMGERRVIDRYRFGQGYPMRVIARDGSWEVPCTIIDVSRTGAKIHLDGPVDGIDLKAQDFILKLSQFGTARRPCELVWHRGEFIGVRFLKPHDPLGGPSPDQ